jgi:hypothetical protein
MGTLIVIPTYIAYVFIVAVYMVKDVAWLRHKKEGSLTLNMVDISGGGTIYADL